MPTLEKDFQKATANFNEFVRRLPPELVYRENNLVTTFSRLPLDSLGKLHALYMFMEELHPYLARVTPCKKGCDFCCRIPVSVSPLEIKYMEIWEPKLADKVGPVSLDTTNFCPFLMKGGCSIYGVRPFACRSHVMFSDTAYWCHPDRCHTVEFPLFEPTEIKAVYSELAGGTFMDIRAITKDFT